MIGCGTLLRRLAVTLVLEFVAVGARAAHLTTLYSFTNSSDGAEPYGGVVQDAAGVLYGTTSAGGDPSCQTGGSSCGYYGTVYSFTRGGGLKTLVRFTGPNGHGPGYTLLLKGTTLYGTTGLGGAANDGVVFSVHTDGSGFTLLHQFSGADGNGPVATPRMGADGTLYGVAYLGGPDNQGLLFSIKPDGTYTVLHNFTGGPDGGLPRSLLMSPAGVVVGSTFSGGATSTCSAPLGCGVVFSYAPAAGKFGVTYTLDSKNQVAEPLLGSIGPDSTVYGVATPFINGNGIEESDVFALKSGIMSTVGRLTLYDSGTQYPGPTLAPDGSLVLTDGLNNYGVGGNIARIKDGKVVADIGFSSGDPGYGPSGQPIVSKTGSVIGTTYLGGLPTQFGTIYEVTP